jgi:hypothetical protein
LWSFFHHTVAIMKMIVETVAIFFQFSHVRHSEDTTE